MHLLIVKFKIIQMSSSPKIDRLPPPKPFDNSVERVDKASSKLQPLVRQLYAEGKNVRSLQSWCAQNIGAILFRTDSGTEYVVEPTPEGFSRVTMIADVPPFYSERDLSDVEIVAQKDGSTTESLEVGSRVDMYSLPGKASNPVPTNTTTEVIEIRYLPGSDS